MLCLNLIIPNITPRGLFSGELMHGRNFPFQKLVPKLPGAYTRWGLLSEFYGILSLVHTSEQAQAQTLGMSTRRINPLRTKPFVCVRMPRVCACACTCVKEVSFAKRQIETQIVIVKQVYVLPFTITIVRFLMRIIRVSEK